MEPEPGHENVLTTFTSYGNLTQHRQDEILQRMAVQPERAENPPRLLVAMDPALIDRIERLITDLGTAGQATDAAQTSRASQHGSQRDSEALRQPK